MWTLYEGDCLEVMRTLPSESVDAVVTDPPYGIDYQSAWRIDPAQRYEKIANDKQPFIWFLHDAYRLVKDGGALICFCRWDVQEAFRQAIGWAGFEVKSQVIWDREHHGMGDLQAAYAPCHDVIWFAVKGDFAFPNKRPTSVVRVPRIGGEALRHPNEKPVSLMQALIRQVTRPGATVLDPFAGSGATIEAAEKEDRDSIGVELSREYCAIIRERMSKVQQPLMAIV